MNCRSAVGVNLRRRDTTSIPRVPGKRAARNTFLRGGLLQLRLHTGECFRVFEQPRFRGGNCPHGIEDDLAEGIAVDVERAAGAGGVAAEVSLAALRKCALLPAASGGRGTGDDGILLAAPLIEAALVAGWLRALRSACATTSAWRRSIMSDWMRLA